MTADCNQSDFVLYQLQAYNSKKCEPKMSLAIHPRPLKGCRRRTGGGGQGARGSLRPDRPPRRLASMPRGLASPVVAARRRLRAEARRAPWLALTVRHQGEGTARGRVVAAEARARAREWSASGACGLGDVSRSATAPTVPPPLPVPVQHLALGSSDASGQRHGMGQRRFNAHAAGPSPGRGRAGGRGLAMRTGRTLQQLQAGYRVATRKAATVAPSGSGTSGA